MDLSNQNINKSSVRAIKYMDKQANSTNVLQYTFYLFIYLFSVIYTSIGISGKCVLLIRLWSVPGTLMCFRKKKKTPLSFFPKRVLIFGIYHVLEHWRELLVKHCRRKKNGGWPLEKRMNFLFSLENFELGFGSVAGRRPKTHTKSFKFRVFGFYFYFYFFRSGF